MLAGERDVRSTTPQILQPEHFDELYRGHRIDARYARQAELARRVKRERLIDPQLRTFRFPIPLPSSQLFREQEDDQAIL